MISNGKDIQLIVNGKLVTYKYVELEGLSTDAKPTEFIANGSKFLEGNTGKVYWFDQTNSQWREL